VVFDVSFWCDFDGKKAVLLIHKCWMTAEQYRSEENLMKHLSLIHYESLDNGVDQVMTGCQHRVSPRQKTRLPNATGEDPWNWQVPTNDVLGCMENYTNI
jgi:hypothetical protein